MKNLFISCMVLYSGFTTLCTTIYAHTHLPQATISVLMKEFAPELRFHHKENYFPCTTSWFAQRSELRHRNPDGSTSLVLPRPLKNSSILGGYPTKDYPQGFNELNDYYLHPLEDNATRAGEPLINNQCQVPCYVHIQDKNNGGVVLQYLFFYAYQGYTVGVTIAGQKLFDVGSHVGDWEHIDVHLKRSNEPRNTHGFALDEVHYAAHGSKPHGELVKAIDLKSVGNHPIVWVAQWGHASHAKNVGFDKSTLDNTSDTGARWRCWQVPLINVGDRDNPTPGQEWLIFGGRWGNTKEVTNTKLTTQITNSPPGPAIDSGWWRHQPEQFDHITDVIASFSPERASDYFDLYERIPTRVRALRWQIIHPQADDIIFSVNEYRYLKKDRKNIYGPMGNNAITGISPYNKNLYMSDVKSKTGKKLQGKLTIRVWAIEE